MTSTGVLDRAPAGRRARRLHRRVATLLGLVLLPAGRCAGAQIPAAPAMTVSSAVAGFQPLAVTATTNYAPGLVFTGQRKIVGRINATMPANTTLKVRLTAASGGTSLGDVILDTTDRDLVIAATSAFFTNVTIRYTFTPLVTAGVIPTSTRTTTYTVLAYP